LEQQGREYESDAECVTTAAAEAAVIVSSSKTATVIESHGIMVMMA
jgi:hypothetical protein